MTKNMKEKPEIMKKKIFMITGANSGIGKATAIELAHLGATLVLVCRNQIRAEKAVNEIIKKTGNELIDFILADLSSQREIHNLVSEFKSRYNKLHVLINNAGVNLSKRIITMDGIEATFAVNYLAQYMLCNLLFNTLKNSAPARIVNVTSSYQAKAINFEDLNGEKHYTQMKAYRQSKLAIVLFTYEFARRIKGTGVSVNCLHPGIIKTNMVRNFRPFVKYFYPLVGLFMKSPKRGAKTPVYLATSPEIDGITGQYFKRRKKAKSVKISYDETLAKQLWEVSVKLTNVDLQTT